MTVESRLPVALLQLIGIRIVLIQVQASTASARSLCAKLIVSRRRLCCKLASDKPRFYPDL
jgi:hypothetical protein